MTSYIMYDILKPSVFWKIWRRGPIWSFLGGLGWPWSDSDAKIGRWRTVAVYPYWKATDKTRGLESN